MWKQAQLRWPEPWQGGWHCRACPIGASNAGKTAPEAHVRAAAETLRNICSRCLRLTPRLVNQRHCVSCFNRHREAQKGRNAKGGVPQLCARLHTVEVAVSEGDVVRLERVVEVISSVEAIIILARTATGPLGFGRAAGTLVTP